MTPGDSGRNYRVGFCRNRTNNSRNQIGVVCALQSAITTWKHSNVRSAETFNYVSYLTKTYSNRLQATSTSWLKLLSGYILLTRKTEPENELCLPYLGDHKRFLRDNPLLGLRYKAWPRILRCIKRKIAKLRLAIKHLQTPNARITINCVYFIQERTYSLITHRTEIVMMLILHIALIRLC